MSFERWIIDLLPPWVIDEGWLPHLALFAFLIGLGLLPTLLRGLGLVLAALLRVIFAALRAILPAALVGLGYALAIMLTVAVRAALPVWLIARGARHRKAWDQGGAAFGPETTTGSHTITEACTLLGLPESGFTPDDLKRAYRRAIKQAHPDQGGTDADTRAILNARDRISEHFGWR